MPPKKEATALEGGTKMGKYSKWLEELFCLFLCVFVFLLNINVLHLEYL